MLIYSYLAGSDVDTSSPEWRHECECQWLLTNKPTRSQKHLYLYGVVDRQHLMALEHKTGRMVLASDYTSRWVVKTPLMKHRGLEGADRLLADAKRLYELTQR